MQRLFGSHEHMTEGAAILWQSSLRQQHHKQGRHVAKVSNVSCANTFQLFIGKEWTKGLCPEERKFKAKRQQTVLLLYKKNIGGTARSNVQMNIIICTFSVFNRPTCIFISVLVYCKFGVVLLYFCTVLGVTSVSSPCYWVVQWSWFAWVNALGNLSCKKLREDAVSLPGQFLSRHCFTLCIIGSWT